MNRRLPEEPVDAAGFHDRGNTYSRHGNYEKAIATTTGPSSWTMDSRTPITTVDSLSTKWGITSRPYPTCPGQSS